LEETFLKMAKLIFVLVSIAGILLKGTSPYSMGAPDQVKMITGLD
jgi:hypothetical protein